MKGISLLLRIRSGMRVGVLFIGFDTRDDRCRSHSRYFGSRSCRRDLGRYRCRGYFRWRTGMNEGVIAVTGVH